MLLPDSNNLSTAIIDLLANSKVLFEGACAASVMVLQVSDNIAVKITSEKYSTTELASSKYLQDHIPTFPAPQPHGLIQLGHYNLLFTTLIPGLNLEKA